MGELALSYPWLSIEGEAARRDARAGVPSFLAKRFVSAVRLALVSAQ